MSEQTTLTKLDVFLSSPGDVQEERAIVKNVIRILNDLPHINRHFVLKALAYENNVPPVIGERPQKTVDRYMRRAGKSDIFICIPLAPNGHTRRRREDGRDVPLGHRI
jgi:hypothetical protein